MGTINHETLGIANSGTMWLLSLAIISIVLIQTAIFFNMAKKRVKETKILSDNQVNRALRIGAIGTVGPAVAVFAVAVALIVQVGGPLTLARVGIIGSATFEMIAAKIGSAGTVGTENFTPQMLSAAAWLMTLGGSGWLIMVLFSAKHINKLQEKLSSTNPLTIQYMASFAPFAIFFSLAYSQVTKPLLKGASQQTIAQILALAAGAGVVLLINKVSKGKENLKWLKEWAMGFAVIAAMIVGSIVF